MKLGFLQIKECFKLHSHSAPFEILFILHARNINIFINELPKQQKQQRQHTVYVYLDPVTRKFIEM